MTYSFSSTEIEDTTGLTTAIVYENTSVTIAWLDDRRDGVSVLGTKTDVQQHTAMLEGTQAAEDSIRPYFFGAEITKDQGMLFPSRGAYGSRRGGTGILFDSDEVPNTYIEGVRELVELSADGKLWPSASADRHRIKSVSRRGHSVTLTDDFGESIEALHPRIWRLLKSALPPAALWCAA